MRTLRFDIVSIFPGMFESPFGDSIIERAREKGLLDIRVHDLRDYTLNKHRKVDDTPFGGGVGMVMNLEPIVRARTIGSKFITMPTPPPKGVSSTLRCLFSV